MKRPENWYGRGPQFCVPRGLVYVLVSDDNGGRWVCIEAEHQTRLTAGKARRLAKRLNQMADWCDEKGDEQEGGAK